MSHKQLTPVPSCSPRSSSLIWLRAPHFRHLSVQWAAACVRQPCSVAVVTRYSSCPSSLNNKRSVQKPCQDCLRSSIIEAQNVRTGHVCPTFFLFLSLFSHIHTYIHNWGSGGGGARKNVSVEIGCFFFCCFFFYTKCYFSG